MNSKIIIAVVLVIAVVGVGAYFLTAGPSPEPEPNGENGSNQPNGDIVPEEAMEEISKASNQFALELYQNLTGGAGNLFFSPYSISTALAMTYEGARGETAQEMQSALHLPENDSVRQGGFTELQKTINQENEAFELHTANALWAQGDYPFLQGYLDLVEQYYGGKTTNLDFINQTEQARQTINAWVEEKTNNKIEDLIPEGALNHLTRLVLTNAIYFKGTWLTQFDQEKTEKEPFYLNDEQNVEVEMMRLVNLEETEFNYFGDEEIQLLELPYTGEKLSMFVILPRGFNLMSMEKNLTLEKISQWQNNLEKRKIDVYLPKFKLEAKYSLPENLKALGIEKAFTDTADFSGMDGSQNLFISDVIHQAFIEVNEEGAEAAAAAAVVMELEAIPDQNDDVFKANRPFLFFIQEKETGAILFLGRLVDPS